MKISIPFYGLFLSFALILGFVESLIPISFGVPGVKLGLCNLLVLLFLASGSPWQGLFLNLCRVVLSGFLFGNVFGIIYGICGALLSFFCMLAVYSAGLFTITTASIIGGMAHNIGQLFAAGVVLGFGSVFWYSPMLMVCGASTGFLMGVLCSEVLPRLPKSLF